MGKKKTKSDNQYLFIDFVNSGLNRKDIFYLIDRTLEYFPDDEEAMSLLALNECPFDQGEIKSGLIDELKMVFDIKKIEDFKTSSMSRLETLGRFCELVSKRLYFDLTKKEKNRLIKDFSNIAKRKHPVLKGIYKIVESDIFSGMFETRRNLYGKRYKEIGDLMEFIYSLKFSQLKLKKILGKIVFNIKLEEDLLETIQDYCSEVRTSLFFGENTYLKKGKVLSMEKVNLSWGYPYQFLHKIFEPAFYDSLVEFLCTPKWKNLKQCPGVCGGKFFIATGNMKHHSAECGKATQKKRERESGRGKARQKKHRDKKKREKECRKKEQLKELRESAKGIA